MPKSEVKFKESGATDPHERKRGSSSNSQTADVLPPGASREEIDAWRKRHGIKDPGYYQIDSNTIEIKESGQRVNVSSDLPEAKRQQAIQEAIAKSKEPTEPKDPFAEKRKEQANRRFKERRAQEEAARQKKIYVNDPEGFNQYLREQGIDDAEEYFKALREENNAPEYQTTYQFFVPRTVAPGETMSQAEAPIFTPGSKPFSLEGVSGVKTLPAQAREAVTLIEAQASKAQLRVKYLPAPFAQVGLVATGFYSGVVKGSLGVGRFLTETVRGKFPKSPGEVPEYLAYDIAGGILTGTSEFLGETVQAISTGNLYEIGEAGGEYVAYGKAGATFKGTFKEAARAADLPGNAAKVRAEITFQEATASTPLDVAYEFKTNAYDIQGRKGVIVPPEFEGLGQREVVIGGERIARAAPELQTQLYPKKLSASEYEAYLKAEGLQPSTPQPLSLLDLSKQEPNLGKELAKEFGQTVFNPDSASFVRDLTPAERLKIAKEQAGALNPDLQKTLPGYLPTGKDTFVMLKDGKKVFIKSKSEIEIREPPLFAIDPISAALISIERELPGAIEGVKSTLRDFKRTNIEIIPRENIINAREPGIKELPFKAVSEDRVLQNTPEINIRARSLINIKPAISNAPTIKIRSEIEQGQRQPQGSRLRSRSAQALEISTDQSSQQQPIQTQTPTVQLEFKRNPAAQVIQEKTAKSFKSPFPQSPKSEKKRKEGTISVKVRRRGVFQTVASAETEEEALQIGEGIAKATAAASFKAERGGEALELKAGRGFAASRKERGVLIQKRGFRISSAGEKAEITFKGIRSSREKRNRKKGFSLF